MYLWFDDFFIRPRNLNASNKKGKKRVDEDNEMDVMHGEDREIEEEGVLPILHDSDNTSRDIDIDINLEDDIND